MKGVVSMEAAIIKAVLSWVAETREWFAMALIGLGLLLTGWWRYRVETRKIESGDSAVAMRELHKMIESLSTQLERERSSMRAEVERERTRCEAAMARQEVQFQARLVARDERIEEQRQEIHDLVDRVRELEDRK